MKGAFKRAGNGKTWEVKELLGELAAVKPCEASLLTLQVKCGSSLCDFKLSPSNLEGCVAQKSETLAKLIRRGSRDLVHDTTCTYIGISLPH